MSRSKAHRLSASIRILKADPVLFGHEIKWINNEHDLIVWL